MSSSIGRNRGGFDGKLAVLRSQLRREPNPELQVSRFRSSCKTNEILYYAQKLNDLPEARTYAMGIPFPRTLQELNVVQRQWRDEFQRELLWSACQIRVFAKQLNQFFLVERAIERACLTGHYVDARSSLKTVESEFGYSLWYLQTLIAILELTEGLESQKRFTQKIIQDSSLSAELRLHVYFFSLRAEKSVSPERFQSFVRDAVPRALDETDGAGQYYAFRWNFFGSVRFQDPRSILLLDRDASIIDRYQSFIRLCQLIVADPDLEQYTKHLIRPLQLLLGKIADKRLLNVASVLALDVDYGDTALSRELVTYADRYSAGKYRECLNAIEQLPDRMQCNFEMFEIAAYASARAGDGSFRLSLSEPKMQLLTRLREIILKTERSQDSFHELQKLCFMFQEHSWAPQLFAFLMREHQHGSYTVPERYVLLGDLNGIPLNPRLSCSIKNQTAFKKYFSTISSAVGDSLSKMLYEACGRGDSASVLALVEEGLPESRASKYAGHVCVANKDFKSAEQRFLSLCETGHYLDHQDGLEGLVLVFLNSGQVAKAVDAAVSGILRTPQMRARLPLDRVLASVELGSDPELKRNICLPILYDIYARSIGGERDVRRSLAYEEFLNAQNFARPSQIRSHEARFQIESLKYFLRYVCVTSVMDTSTAFDSSDDIENERIAVCQMLTELDPENTAIYSEEIKGITQRLMISRGIREIERGKIHVDIDGIKASVEAEGKEIFSRFRAFQSSRYLGAEAEEIFLALALLERTRGVRVSIPGDEKLEAFRQFFRAIRDAFVSSNEYGLDGYLSVGIRHGTLSGQLRSAFEREELVTQRDNRDIYRENVHWRDRLTNEGVNPTSIKKVMARFSDFSKSVDDSINRIRNEEFQIRTEGKNQNGLFDYAISAYDFLKLQQKILPSTSYEEAVDFVIEKLWELTDRALLKTRDRVSNYKLEFTGQLDALQQDMRALLGSGRNPILDDAIVRSRTAIQEELDKVSGWFTRSGGEKIADFQAEFPFEIALRTVNNIHPTRTISPRRRIRGDRLLSGNSLRSMASIVIMLLENALTHSRLQDHVPDIEIDCVCDDKGLELRMTNEVSADVNIDEKSQKVHKIMEEIANAKRSTDMVKREGGSGFHKIAKILNTDLGCEFELNAFFENQQRFVFLLKVMTGRIFV